MKKIFWIDLASEGDASFYSNAWYSVLGTNAEYFVHKSVSYSHYFYRYGRFKNKSTISNFFIFLEHSALLTILALTIVSRKYKVVINIYQPFKYYEFFLRILKIKNCESIIILHDVKEFGTNNYPNIIMSSNRRIIHFTNKIILHNHLNLFKELYCFKKDLITIPFPVRISFSNIISNSKFKDLNQNYILFIGTYREEKGLDVLLNLKKEDLRNFLLVIASNIPYALEKLFNEKLESKVLIFNKKISDLDLEYLVANATYGICPYKMGSNSGIYSTFLSNKIPTITSNTSIFDNFHVIKELRAKDNNDYSDIILDLPTNDSIIYKNYQRTIAVFLAERKYKFNMDIISKLL